MRVCVSVGRGKTVVIVDKDGTEEVMRFRNRRGFEQWAARNDILDDDRVLVQMWDVLQDGGRYYSATTSLHKTVCGVGVIVLFW